MDQLERNQKGTIDFEAIAASEKFNELKNEKKKFVVPFTFIFLIFYIMLPILTSYTDILERPAVGSISWVWVYSLFLFIMTWTFVMLYVRKAASLDISAKEILTEQEVKGGKAV